MHGCQNRKLVLMLMDVLEELMYMTLSLRCGNQMMRTVSVWLLPELYACFIASFFYPCHKISKKTYAFIHISTNIVHLITVYLLKQSKTWLYFQTLFSNESDTKLTNSGHHHSVHNGLEKLSDIHEKVLKAGKRGASQGAVFSVKQLRVGSVRIQVQIPNVLS